MNISYIFLRRVIFGFFTFAITNNIISQGVGINSNGSAPNQHSILDVKSTNKGLLIPRLTTIQKTNLGSSIGLNEEGMFVYDNDLQNLYQWDGSQWVLPGSDNQNLTGASLTGNTLTIDIENGTSTSVDLSALVSSGGSNDWSLNGNSGTTAANFLGTTDLTPLSIRTNNVEKIRINTSGVIETLNNGYSVFVGEEAGYNDNQTNNQNVFVGYQSGYSNVDGYQNVFIGPGSGFQNTIGNDNIGIGIYSISSNTIGLSNVAIGSYALSSNIDGESNVSIGYSTLSQNTSGLNNIAIGNSTLSSNTTGYYNIALGVASMSSMTTGNSNIALGISSLQSSIGNSNIGIGTSSLQGNTTGNYNIAIGDQSFASNTHTNSIAIGYLSNISADNQVRIGNTSTASIGGFQSWTNLSDKRFKYDIKNNVPGIEFIMKLNPVTYKLDYNKINEYNSIKINIDNPNTSKIYSGFLAQDVEQAAKELDYNFSGIDNPKNDKDYYGLKYAEFVVPIIRAMQEQEEKIIELEKKINLLQKL